MQDRPIEISEVIATDVAAVTLPQPARWFAIGAGAIAGLATTVLMVTLGIALGVSTGAVAAAQDANAAGAAKTIGIGAMLWSVLTAVVVGIVGGGTARCIVPRVVQRPALLGFLVWSLGLVLGVVVLGPAAALGAGGATALAAGAGTAAAMTAADDAPAGQAGTAERNEARAREVARAAPSAEEAAGAATAAMWTLFVAQICGLIATIVAAIAFKRGLPPG
jgi:hypothetical protein